MATDNEREYNRNWYHKNKHRIRASKARNEAKYINKKKKIIIDYLKINPCVDCGEVDIIVLDFDHVDRDTKSDNVSNMIQRSSISTLIDEIKKCEVRCANCHRRKTAKQFNTYKFRDVL